GSVFSRVASGKIHRAAPMNAAVMMTNIESSGRIGEPLQKARTAATISATAETAALTSVGTAIALCLSVGADGNRRRLVGTARGAAQVPLHEPRIVAVEQVADHAAVEIPGPDQPVGDGEGQIHVTLHHQPGVVVRGLMAAQRVDTERDGCWPPR